MEREQPITTGLENDDSGKIQFPNLLVAAAVLFAVNIVLALFFYFSPNVLAGPSKSPDQDQYAIAKASPFEERVQERRYIARTPEKIRPVIEAVIQLDDRALTSALYTDSSSSTALDAVATFTPAAYHTNTGNRPVTSGSDLSDDGSARSPQVAASFPAHASDLQ
jgi:hypothetical protein